MTLDLMDGKVSMNKVSKKSLKKCGAWKEMKEKKKRRFN